MSAGQARPAASPNPKLDGLKRAAAADVDGMRELTQQMVDQIFSYAELGYQEVETSKYLTDVLERNGFRIERNVAGMPTGWTATWGSGRPVIALGSDLDDIPQASQKPGVAYHDPIVAGAPGHGEGHNSGMPLQVTAALAVKKIMERERLPGTLKLWPGVAEELGGGKAYFVRAGVFKDVDVCLFTHVGSNFNVSFGDRLGTGVVSVEYTFTGESAHAAANPWRGRSALDAVELMDIGWNFRREHLRLQQRSHYVITNGGDQPNVVPSNASVWYYFREIDYPHIKELREIGDTMAKAAAMMTNTEVSWKITGAAWPQHFNKVVAETTYENMKAVGLPRWDQDDITLARAIQKEVGQPQIGLAVEIGTAAGSGPAGRQLRRRVGRHRRRVVERADGDAELPVEHSRDAGPQLGERGLDGDADRAQGRHRRRQGHRDDDPRSPAPPGARPAGVGLLQDRADEGSEVSAADRPRRSAARLHQRQDDGAIPAGAAQVLLRCDASTRPISNSSESDTQR